VLQLGEIFKTPKITNSKREGEREKGKKFGCFNLAEFHNPKSHDYSGFKSTGVN
jgi:hypothetical protein